MASTIELLAQNARDVIARLDSAELVWRDEPPFAGPWIPIGSAPRDGRVISVTDLDTMAIEMWWNACGTNALVQAGVGIWESVLGSLTWSEADGAGPTHWRPCADEMPFFLRQLAACHGR